ncbi:hypothetical protein BCR42DRAFT_427274 [Absidia repens]|uniref:F-box domain-containing protein n=1 Tax=Absidia repens TaxID=90262 RepID=A0A1X2I0L1_9FUNG|nr:hypothetical protein BCR42DRAFT_427274 [Absidia repens]
MGRSKRQVKLKLMNPTATTSEQLDSHYDIKDGLTNLDIGNHDRTEKEIIYSNHESNSTDINYNNFQLNFADKNHLKRYARDITDYTATEIEIKHNGVIVLTPHFRQFPSELVTLIVSHCLEQRDLWALSLVSKQFYTIANPLLWCAPKIQHSVALDKFLYSVATFQPPMGFIIRKMNFSCPQWNDVHFSLLIPHLRHLEELNINGSVLNVKESFRHLPRHCPNLTSVDLECSTISSAAYTELGLHCHHLCQLTLRFVPYLSSDSLKFLLNCPLQKLTFIFNYCHEQKKCEDMMRGLWQFTLLTHLVMKNMNALHGRLVMQQNSEIHPPWPRLSLLHIDSCDKITDSDLTSFANSHPHLMELRLGRADLITDSSLFAIASALPCLTTLYLNCNTTISENGILKLIEKCLQLTSLTLMHCTRIPWKVTQLDHEAIESYRNGGIPMINH